MENEKTNQELEKIDLFELLRKFLPCLRQFWALVLVLTVLGGGLMFLYTRLSYHPMYRSEAMFTVGLNYEGVTDVTPYSYSYDKEAAKQVAEAFPYILESDAMQEAIYHQLDTSYINGKTTSSTIPGTNFFLLSTTSSNAQDSLTILQATIDTFPNISQHVLGGTRLNMIQEPVLPSSPHNPFVWQRNVVIGMAGGMLLGLAILAVMAVLRKTALSPDDVKRVINLPCLARIPDVKLKKRASSSNTGLLITNQEFDSAFSESLRLLRLKLLRQLKKNDQIIMFTSSLPSEGKSSLATNVALSLAKDNKKVLLVDGDLRGPSIKTLLNITPPSTGLGEYLKEGSDSIHFFRYKDTSLYVFAGDEVVHTPTPLLRHEKLKKFIQALRPMFDYVILDTPPCAMMADAVAFAQHADEVVYVIREDYATTSQIFDGVQALSTSGASICGFVFSRSSTSHSSHYGYGYGYGRYGYGYSSKTASKKQEKNA